MEQDIQQTGIAPEQVNTILDEILARHMERSIGARQGPGELSLNLVTISSLVFLAEKESQIDTSPHDPPERFTRETLMDKLDELGLEPDEGVQGEVQQMIEKGYVDVESDGEFLAKKPTMDMALLLDKAFPGMPGMNFVAYLFQTLDEMRSGRKAPELAVSHLDQTLKMHGGGLSKKPAGSSGAQAKVSAQGTGPSTEALKSALSAKLRKRQEQEQRTKTSPDLAGQSKILTASGGVKPIEIKEVLPKEEKLVATPLTPRARDDGPLEEPEVPGEEPLPTEMMEEELRGDEVPSEQVPATLSPEGDSDTEVRDETIGAAPREAASDAVEPEDLSEVTKPEPSSVEERYDEEEAQTETARQQEESPVSDEQLEAQILAFEQNLAMTCPLCTAGKVQRKETAKGKAFFVCSEEACVFVSWGKPYLLECGWCKNPFLIESVDNAGETVLKCPRATCAYQQDMPGKTRSPSVEQGGSTLQDSSRTQSKLRKPRKRKKVVRRRVVRRKR
jgi:ssDNA-binding Zn-finger/Zn-ribbon topoisomerase 1